MDQEVPVRSCLLYLEETQAVTRGYPLYLVNTQAVIRSCPIDPEGAQTVN